MATRGKRTNNRLENEPTHPPAKRRKGRPPNTSLNPENDAEMPSAIPNTAVGSSSAPNSRVPPPSVPSSSSCVAPWQPKSIENIKISSIYNRSSSEAPAELFRKDLISAMKLPDSEPLSSEDYWIITDQWKQEWEKGVQVPVNPDSLPVPNVTILQHPVVQPQHDFKLHKNRFLRITKDESFSPELHYLTNVLELSESACTYDLDQVDEVWLKMLNKDRRLCGVDSITEEQFERVIEELEVRCWDKIQVIMKSDECLGIEYDENVICDVCRSPDSEEANEMVFCDKCNICVHQACYGITAIPSGQWLCRTCSVAMKPECVLCPNKGGAMKSTKSGKKWAHVSCALWIPEVSIGCVDRMEPITKISSIPQSRWALICVLCREKVGACIQCSVKTCKTAYHVTCAFQHGLEMRAIIEEGNAEDGVKLRSYCLKHSVSKGKKDPKGTNNNGIAAGVDDDDCRRRKNRKDMTTEERNQVRAKKLQSVEEEFHKHVNIKDISCHLLEVDQDAIVSIYNYWILKRKSRQNRALIPAKSDCAEKIVSKQEEEADIEKRKMVVHLRQDLEWARNLCYMVNRREKLSRSIIQFFEKIFHKQVAVLSEPGKKRSESFVNTVINANCGPSIYDKFYSTPDPQTAPVTLESVQELLVGGVGVSRQSKQKNIQRTTKAIHKKSNPNGNLSKDRSDLKKIKGHNNIASSSDSSSDESDCQRSSPLKGTHKLKKSNLLPLAALSESTSSSEDDFRSNDRLTHMQKEFQRNLEMISSDNDSDDLHLPLHLPSADKKSSSKKEFSTIYSDSESTSGDKEPNGSSTSDYLQQKFRTKAAKKEFNMQQLQQKPKAAKKDEKSPKDDVRENEKPKEKEKPQEKGKSTFSSEFLVVPQRQAAKKASENLRCTNTHTTTTTAQKKDGKESRLEQADSHSLFKTSPDKKEREKPAENSSSKSSKAAESKSKAEADKEREKDKDRDRDKEKDKDKERDKEKDKDKEKAKEKANKPRGRPPKQATSKEDSSPVKPVKATSQRRSSTSKPPPKPSKSASSSSSSIISPSIAYVPQRQAAKKAAEHIKSGLGKPVANEVAGASADEPKETKEAPSRDHSPPPAEPPTPQKTPKTKTPPARRRSHANNISTSSSSSGSSSSSSSSSSDDSDADEVTPPRKKVAAVVESKKEAEKPTVIPIEIEEPVLSPKSPDVEEIEEVNEINEKPEVEEEKEEVKVVLSPPSSPPSPISVPSGDSRTSDKNESEIEVFKEEKTEVPEVVDLEEFEKPVIDEKPISPPVIPAEEPIDEFKPPPIAPITESEIIEPERAETPKQVEVPVEEMPEISEMPEEVEQLPEEVEKKEEMELDEPKSPPATPPLTPSASVFGNNDSMEITPIDSNSQTDLAEVNNKSEEVDEEFKEPADVEDKHDNSFDLKIDQPPPTPMVDNIFELIGNEHLPSKDEEKKSNDFCSLGLFEPATRPNTEEDSAQATMNLVEKLRLQKMKRGEQKVDEPEEPPAPPTPVPKEPPLPEKTISRNDDIENISTLFEKKDAVHLNNQSVPFSENSINFLDKAIDIMSTAASQQSTTVNCDLQNEVEPPGKMANAFDAFSKPSFLKNDKLDDYDESLIPPSPYISHRGNMWDENDMIQTRRSVSTSPSSTSGSIDGGAVVNKKPCEDPMAVYGPPPVFGNNYFRSIDSFANASQTSLMSSHQSHQVPPNQVPVQVPVPDNMLNGSNMLGPDPYSNHSNGGMFHPAFLNAAMPPEPQSHNVFDNSLPPLLGNSGRYDDVASTFARPAYHMPHSHLDQQQQPPPVYPDMNNSAPFNSYICDVERKEASPNKRSSTRCQQNNKAPDKNSQSQLLELLNSGNGKANKFDAPTRQRGGRGGRGGASNRARGRGRGRGRGQSAIIPRIPPLPVDNHFPQHMGSIQNNLRGTVYDFEEDFDNVENLKSLRDSRKSLECRMNTNSQAPVESIASPVYDSCQMRKTRIMDTMKSPCKLPMPLPLPEPPIPTPSILDTIVTPVLPGPVDMRTYNSSFETQHSTSSQEAYNNNLLGAFDSGIADQTLHDIDEEDEKKFQSALRASGNPPPPPPANETTLPAELQVSVSMETTSEEISIDSDTVNTRTTLQDSRSQLKFKIKGPLACPDNYHNTSPVKSLVQAAVSQRVNTQISANAQITSNPNSGTSNIRRMRKKELLRQYWSMDMNLEDSASFHSTEIKPSIDPSVSQVVGVPNSDESMHLLPASNSSADTNKRKKVGTRELRQLEKPSYEENPRSERKKSSCSSGSNDNTKYNRKRRGRSKTADAEDEDETPQSLKITIRNNSVEPAPANNVKTENRRLVARPPKKRQNYVIPSLEILKRESMNFRKQMMANFDDDEEKTPATKKPKVKSGKEHKRKKKAKYENVTVTDQQNEDGAPKIILRIGKRKSAEANTPANPVAPIKLKLARNSDGGGYVIGKDKLPEPECSEQERLMKNLGLSQVTAPVAASSEGKDKAKDDGCKSISLDENHANAATTDHKLLPNKDCEGR